MSSINILAGQIVTLTYTVVIQTGDLHISVSGITGTSGGSIHVTNATSFNQTYAIDGTGNFTVALVPGTYDVTYTPPVGMITV